MSVKPLILIPHAGQIYPIDIPIKNLRHDLGDLLYDEDLDTNLLYDSRDILNCHYFKFPYHRGYIDVNQHPDDLDNSVPIYYEDRKGNKFRIYKEQPTIEFRRNLIKKYHTPFHQYITKMQKNFIFDGHSAILGSKGEDGSVFTSDIEISNFQKTKFDPKEGTRSCSNSWVERYAELLNKYLSGWKLKININTPYTVNTFGYTMFLHSKECPVMMQEVNELLYTNKYGKYNYLIIEELRRIFGYCLKQMLKEVKII
jgi:hypothetical protein